MLPKSPRLPATLYTLASLTTAFVVAVLVVAGATRWLPEGRAGIDHIVVPIVLFPLIWIVLAIWLYAARNRRTVWAVVAVIALINVGLAGYGFVSP